MREAHVGPNRLLAVGASAPGAVDRERGMVVALAPDLEGWSKVPMGAILKRALRAPVVVENNVNLAILGERWQGVARGHDSCAFIWLGTGIGAGIVVNGELHHGSHYLAGEIALMCMGMEYVDQDFGSRGCLETLAGQRAILTRWSNPSGDGDGARRGGDFRGGAAGGDRRAIETLRETARLIGVATANLSVVLDPSLIVMGGSLVAQGPEPGRRRAPRRRTDRAHAQPDRHVDSGARSAARRQPAHGGHRGAAAPAAGAADGIVRT